VQCALSTGSGKQHAGCRGSHAALPKSVLPCTQNEGCIPHSTPRIFLVRQPSAGQAYNYIGRTGALSSLERCSSSAPSCSYGGVACRTKTTCNCDYKYEYTEPVLVSHFEFHDVHTWLRPSRNLQSEVVTLRHLTVDRTIQTKRQVSRATDLFLCFFVWLYARACMLPAR